MDAITLTLIGNEGCHLCDVAEKAVASVMSDLASNPNAPDVVLEKKSLCDNPELRDAYSEKIPVLLVNGQLFGYWHVDADALRLHILQATTSPQN